MLSLTLSGGFGDRTYAVKENSKSQQNVARQVRENPVTGDAPPTTV